MTSRKIVVLLLLAMYFCSCDNNEEPAVPKSKVRLARVLKYSDSSASQLSSEIDYSYDNVGNMTAESFYSCYGRKSLTMRREYKYVENRKIKQEIFNGEADNLILGHYINYLYSNELLVKEETYRADGSLAHSMNYEYDQHGNKVRQYMDDPEYGIGADMKYTYDSQNRLILEESKESDVRFYKYLKHVFDEYGREVRQEFYNINWDLLKYTDYIYTGDSKSPQSEIRYNKENNLSAEYRHFYDDWGNRTETQNSRGCSYFKRTYDGDLLIEEINYWTWDTGFNDCSESGMSRYEYDEF